MLARMWGEKGTLMLCVWECQCGQPLLNRVGRFLKKLKIELPCHPAISRPGVYWKEMKSWSQRQLCALMFMAAPLTMTKTHRQPEGPSLGEQIKFLSLSHTGMHAHTHRGKRLSHKKGHPAICKSMDGLLGHYTKWNKSDRERQILCDRIYTRNQTTLNPQKQQKGDARDWAGVGRGDAGQRIQSWVPVMRRISSGDVWGQ